MAINHFIRQALIKLIRVYRYAFSLLLGHCCRLEPSCSQYAILAIERFGCLKGGYLSFRRVLRCHPWHPGGKDPVPHCSHQL